MGVQSRIVLYAKNESEAVSAAQAAFARIDALEQIMSDYRPDSELSRLSDSAGGPAVRVSHDLFDVLMCAQGIAKASQGAFDVTSAPLIQLWRSARRTHSLPAATDLKKARQLTGWRKLKLDEAARTVTLQQKGMRLDLGGIGKGHACDQALRALRSRRVARALVEMGGDMALGEAPPGTSGWRVEIDQADETHRWRTLRNCGVSSSGDTQQFVEIGGKRYSHVVDPRTGLGLTDRIAVTVIAPNAMLSDALSTAISVLGSARGSQLASRYRGTSTYIRTASEERRPASASSSHPE